MALKGTQDGWCGTIKLLVETIDKHIPTSKHGTDKTISNANWRCVLNFGIEELLWQNG